MEIYLKNLDKYRDFNENGNIEKFEINLAKISDINDPSCISKLVYFLDDNTEYDEIMFSIIHLIEKFNDDIYVREILNELSAIIDVNPYWARVIHYRIMNSSPTFEAYLRAIKHATNKSKDAIKSLAINIKNEDPDFSNKCNRIIDTLY